MKEDHEPGVCYACRKEKPVRWKNLFTIGSEGTNLCMECEMVIVNILRTMAREAGMVQRQKYIERRKIRCITG